MPDFKSDNLDTCTFTTRYTKIGIDQVSEIVYVSQIHVNHTRYIPDTF